MFSATSTSRRPPHLHVYVSFTDSCSFAEMSAFIVVLFTTFSTSYRYFWKTVLLFFTDFTLNTWFASDVAGSALVSSFCSEYSLMKGIAFRRYSISSSRISWAFFGFFAILASNAFRFLEIASSRVVNPDTSSAFLSGFPLYSLTLYRSFANSLVSLEVYLGRSY
ncbi:hypothetical protein ATCV1_z325L [Acanthocystis turfacea chlorella virus 1]|uniref:Uncharacterized protein z325L n=1 Tax=Chlorovirus heliozoae TaxID=322019 RepID=A7K8T5_9PHYC|nr:hypothetical protein ATCV1_z325L [Acanthocystis turfacea chlorella virus 1]ABT16459.1 hypothetical protein ATCV1_z325L [Acanthocystis turfacea chlorella virus 1]